ncbi:hypothetical protein MTR67_007426 [Solanum verrucosum]|uniref:Reverse transcriptase RNase H-like domain-containing protein n=1 Tax=Solanum verrucosum TaxID=315347 RepID=A0AAF0PZX1_SOLVR|nr:hypothetical protein MTR67_007426 [Solanum verrucosum]
MVQTSRGVHSGYLGRGGQLGSVELSQKGSSGRGPRAPVQSTRGGPRLIEMVLRPGLVVSLPCGVGLLLQDCYFVRGFMVYCDSSDVGMGCVLMQQDRAITYASTQLKLYRRTTPLMT